MSDHLRNTAAMLASPRCGANTRGGAACRAAAVRGATRCRMHGGVPRSGAPRGNRNARKHGRFTAEAMAERKRVREVLGKVRKMLQGLASSS